MTIDLAVCTYQDLTLFPAEFDYRLFYSDPEKRISEAVLNANAFLYPNTNLLNAASKRLAIFIYHLNTLKHAVVDDLDQFKIQISNKGVAFQEFVDLKPNKSIVAIYDSITHIHAMHGLLYSLKSFLDVYASFMANTIGTKGQTVLFGRKKGKYNGISGGRLLDWISNSAPSSFTKKKELCSVIEKHSTEWISEAVDYRDTLSHYGDIDNFVDMHLSREDGEDTKLENIVMPTMPNGKELVEYADYLAHSLIEFIKETVIFLPNVNMDLLSFNEGFDLKPTKGVKIVYDDGRGEVDLKKAKLSRNSPCPCRSGKRYKDCHGRVY